jgi:penicillin-binding protein 1A
MGLVPNLSSGVWVGGEDRSVHFPGMGHGQGASMALPIWALYMQRCYADKSLDISKEPFERPRNLSIEIDCNKKASNKEDTKKQTKKEEDLDF